MGCLVWGFVPLCVSVCVSLSFGGLWCGVRFGSRLGGCELRFFAVWRWDGILVIILLASLVVTNC